MTNVMDQGSTVKVHFAGDLSHYLVAKDSRYVYQVVTNRRTGTQYKRFIQPNSDKAVAVLQAAKV